MKVTEPFVILLIGPPLSGKSTWIKNNYPQTPVISRDEIVMEVAKSRDYNLAFKNVNQKEVDRILKRRLIEAGKGNQSVIIDMTNLNSNRRKETLGYFPNHYKIAVIFPILSKEEYERRNILRNSQDNKWIPIDVLDKMINSMEFPTEAEGFDRIIGL